MITKSLFAKNIVTLAVIFKRIVWDAWSEIKMWLGLKKRVCILTYDYNYAFFKKKQLPPPLFLGGSVGLVAKLEGYLGRKNDPPPDHQIIWQGYTVLQVMSMGFALHGGWLRLWGLIYG